MTKATKIQSLLITELLQAGSVKLQLPDGMVLEIGIVQEDKKGNLEKVKDYCWIIASQKGRTVSMDSYNFSLRFPETTGKIIVEDSTVSQEGEKMKILSAF